ncbi:hypothetical protein HPB50_008543 [Hyalomma asiaticum]|uniref:Uncharacterized protein n=1 Tax=Hyalomma asiaticum TaxID=266040 RepID=A0ACB7SFJ3_HYAAI|nr:hypothetical protein HPB50_008543 [Hyalomma asiaticum]
METDTENICCHSIPKVRAGTVGMECITSHPTFVGRIVNVYGIEVNYLNMIAIHRKEIDAVDIHMCRHN